MNTAAVGRERVLREARALFMERGFSEVSMQQIADAVGVTKAALYYHFRDKEDLFAHVVQQEQDRIITGLRAELEDAGTFRERLDRAARYIFMVVDSDFGRLMSDIDRHISEPCQQSLRLRHKDPAQFFRPYFAQAKAAGELREIDLDLAIQIFLSMLIGLKQMAEHHPEMPPLDDAQVGVIADVFLHGIAARPRD
jgi:AcrR family transcriptional regulator